MAAKSRTKGKRKTASAKASGKGSPVTDVAQQIWLAGLGAFARAKSEGPKLFDSLVKEGSAIQGQQRENAERLVKGKWEDLREAVDERAAQVRGKASETLESLEKAFQTRVQRALQQLGMPTSQEIRALSRKVNELNKSVQALAGSKRRNATAGTAAPAGQDAAI
jgi:poly(hydroxyalkanoate) granule-associated protein